MSTTENLITPTENTEVNNTERLAALDIDHDGLVTDEEVELYRKHVVYYFDHQVKGDILSLSDEDKSRCFQMFKDYSDILEKMFHKGINLVEHILYGDEFKSAKEDPHEGIDWAPSEIVKQYEEWNSKQQ